MLRLSSFAASRLSPPAASRLLAASRLSHSWAAVPQGPPDAILGLVQAFNEDPNPKKADAPVPLKNLDPTQRAFADLVLGWARALVAGGARAARRPPCLSAMRRLQRPSASASGYKRPLRARGSASSRRWAN